MVAAAQAFAERTRGRVRGHGGMMRLVRDVRLIPIVLLAAGCLFALKVTGLVSRRRLYARRRAAVEQRQDRA